MGECLPPSLSSCLPSALSSSSSETLRVTPAYCFHGRASHSHSASPTRAQSAELQQFTGYSQDQLLPAARAITQYVGKNPMAPSRRPLQAVQKKFVNPVDAIAAGSAKVRASVVNALECWLWLCGDL